MKTAEMARADSIKANKLFDDIQAEIEWRVGHACNQGKFSASYVYDGNCDEVFGALKKEFERLGYACEWHLVRGPNESSRVFNISW